MGVGSDLELDDGTRPVRQVRVAVQERADVSRDRVARTKDPGRLIRAHSILELRVLARLSEGFPKYLIFVSHFKNLKVLLRPNSHKY